jgi:hypothetical protein
VTFGAYNRVIVEAAQSNSEFRGELWAVYNRRTADAAKSAMKSRRGFKVFDQFLPLNPSEIFDTNARSAAKGSTVRLSTVGTMTMARAHQWTRYFVFHTAA